jgi:hypothetical protein
LIAGKSCREDGFVAMALSLKMLGEFEVRDGTGALLSLWTDRSSGIA